MDLFQQLHVSPDHEPTLAHQLKQQLTWLIVNGQLNPGDRLPSIHLMADRLGINLHTVRSAYHKLEQDGLVVTRQGRGTHVLSFDPLKYALAARDQISHTIGVILPSLTNPFYHGFLQGVQTIAEESQTLLFVSNTNDDPGAPWRDFYRLSAKGVDGILVVSHDVSEIFHPDDPQADQQKSLPFITVDWPGAEGYSVTVDLESAGYQATRHLMDHGHRRIGLITFTQELANIRPVDRGYRRALEEKGLHLDPSLVMRVPGFDLASGAEGARRLLALRERPTAIFAIADMLALGAIKAIKNAGLRIPQDLAIASFNDIPAAALVEPQLTTVAAPTVQLGKEAMKMLQVLIEGKEPPQREIVLPAHLIVRQSCGEHAIS